MALQKKYRHTYTQLANDPLDVLRYELPNGLTLLLSINNLEPRIYTHIVVRAGAKFDPKETSGLAHYMEHMLFKGTSKIGALNWEKESLLLAQIANLYEQHRKANNPEEKKALYKQIDDLSQEAARLVAPSEYDKLASSIGAQNTNAYTGYDQTVFINDIPANELERWIELEAERFRMMALRLFHTELETVYEEFNISQDQDFKKMGQALRKLLFPNHPYGQKTVLGTAYDLKNPTQLGIQTFFQTYYVPNNMAIVLSGDFDPDQAVDWAIKYFGPYQRKQLPEFQLPTPTAIEQPLRSEVFGQHAPYLYLAWRFGDSQKDDFIMNGFLASLLSNGEVGLLDTELIQNQKLLAASAWVWSYKDYNILGLYGKPRQGQSLEEVEQLLLDTINKLRIGDFDEELIQAVINQFHVQEIKDFESNQNRVETITETFVLEVDWQRFVNRFEWYNQLDKNTIQNYVQTHLDARYAVVHKKSGQDPSAIQVDKPAMTPVQVNRTGVSSFAQQFLSKKTTPIKPTFVDYTNLIHKSTLANGIPFNYVQNPLHELFRFDFIFDMGRLHDPLLGISVLYQELIGTRDASKAEIAKAFFKMGVTFEFFVKDRHTYISIQGLDAYLEPAIELLEKVIRFPALNQAAIDNMVEDVLTRRTNLKTNKDFLLREGLNQYGKFGKFSPLKFRYSEERLKTLKAEELSQFIATLFEFPHQAYYFGPRSMDQVASIIERHHQRPLTTKALPKQHPFYPLPTLENKIYFLHFPMVQAEVIAMSKGTPQFNLEESLYRQWFNEYFGYGLSSIVFQEIRESMAIAYATYAYYGVPNFKDLPHYFSYFLGTQPDKLAEALQAMNRIIEDMPVSSSQMDHARWSVLRQIESERIAPDKTFWEYRYLQNLGYDRDLRQDVYQALQHSNNKDLIEYHDRHIKGRNYHIMILGDEKRMDFKSLESFGKIEQLNLEDVLGSE